MSLSVAIVGPLPPPAGGMANQTRQLAELLRGEGVTVEVVQTQSPYRPAIVAHVPLVRALFRLLPYLLKLWLTLRRVDVVHIMANSGWSWHLFAAPAVWVARLTGRGVVLNYRGGEAAQFFARAFPLVAPTLGRVDKVVVPSDFLRKIFGDYGVSATVVPNIIDLDKFTPPDGFEQNSRSLMLLVARNLEPLYDNESAIHAFKLVHDEVPSATLRIAGSGPQREELEGLVAELGLMNSVEFVGAIDNKDMPALMRSADVLINPSLADNMPISILEAFASGLPVVSTNVGGVPYLVEHERTGLLVEPKSPREIASSVLRVYRERDLRQRLIESAMRAVERYTWSAVWPKLATIYAAAKRPPNAGCVPGRA